MWERREEDEKVRERLKKENRMEQVRREQESYDCYAPCCFAWLLFPIA